MCSTCWASAISAAPQSWRAPWRRAASTCCWSRAARHSGSKQSVRDIVRRSMSRERVQQAIDLCRRFDLILIHGDPTLIGFDRSFAGWEAIRSRAAYTGYIAEQRDEKGADGVNEVLVSVGGGAV